MARKTPQQFVKQRKENDRAQKAKEKMAKRHREKKDNDETEADVTHTTNEILIEKS